MNRQRQEELLAEFIHGTASVEQQQEILSALKADPELKNHLSAMLLIEHELRLQHEPEAKQAMCAEVINRLENEGSGRHFANETIKRIKGGARQQPTTRRVRRRKKKNDSQGMWWAIGAAAALIFVVALWPNETVPVPEKKIVQSKPQPKAVIIDSIGSWKDVNVADIQRGHQARSNRCFLGDRLKSSRAVALHLDDGSVIRVSPGTELIIRGNVQDKIVHLQHGHLDAVISKQGEGQSLVCSTPHGESQIVGTAFRLISEEAKSRLDVTEGRVRHVHQQTKEAVLVDAGYYVEVIHEQDMKVLPIAPVKVEPEPVPVAKPEPVEEIEQPAPVMKPPLYEWKVERPLPACWVRGDIGAHASAVALAAEIEAEHRIIFARLAKADNQSLRSDDRLDLNIYSEKDQQIQVDLFIRDQNPKTKSTLQYIRFECAITASDEWQTLSIPLEQFSSDFDEHLELDMGCFALRILSARQHSFFIKRAALIRP